MRILGQTTVAAVVASLLAVTPPLVHANSAAWTFVDASEERREAMLNEMSLQEIVDQLGEISVAEARKRVLNHILHSPQYDGQERLEVYRERLMGENRVENSGLFDALTGVDVAKVCRRTEASEPGRFGSEITWHAGRFMHQKAHRDMLQLVDRMNPQPGETVVDLGAGFGRLGFVLGATRPGVRFVGYELVRERVIEANRALAALGLRSQLDLRPQDLAKSSELEPAAHYHAYLPFSRPTARHVLGLLERVAGVRALNVWGQLHDDVDPRRSRYCHSTPTDFPARLGPLSSTEKRPRPGRHTR